MQAAIIGLGMVSRTYGDAFANTSAARLVLAHARTAGARAGFVQDWAMLGVKAADTVNDIAASDVDFVIVTTPPDARRDIVRTLADAGKPILMEKPVERSLENATELVEICEAARVPLGIVLQHRARPVVADLRARMPQLGPLHAVEVSVPWWRPQSYYDAPGRGAYARDGGGVLITQAIHTLDLMLALVGPVAAVNAMSATTGLHKMESEDFVCAGLRFASGAVGQLFASTASFPGRTETITMHFDQASVELEAGRLVISHHDGAQETIGQAAASGAGADPMAFTSDWHRFMIEDFVEALECGRSPLVTGREALGVHRLIAALEKASQTGSTVSLEEV